MEKPVSAAIGMDKKDFGGFVHLAQKGNQVEINVEYRIYDQGTGGRYGWGQYQKQHTVDLNKIGNKKELISAIAKVVADDSPYSILSKSDVSKALKKEL